MAKKSGRTGILNAVSDWLKLLALIVLVGEAVILAAMTRIAADHWSAPFYPVLMILFLGVVVLGVFFDRFLAFRKSQDELSMQIGDRKLSVPGKQLDVVNPSLDASVESVYVDSQRGFQLQLPKSPGWSRPEQLEFGDYVARMGNLPQEAIPNFKANLLLHPMGKMFAEGSVMCVSEGDPLDIELTDATTTEALDTVFSRALEEAARRGETITEEQIAAQRQQIIASKVLGRRFRVQNSFAVLIMDKTHAAHSIIAPTLANLFVQNMAQVGGPVDHLVADERTILWGSTQPLQNVRVNGKLGELTQYVINQLTQSDRFIYTISILFSPQTRKSLEVWKELQRMMGSFRMLAS